MGAAPVLDLTALDHLTAAANHARRHSEDELLGHLRTALDDAARADGLAGPREALPPTPAHHFAGGRSDPAFRTK